MGFFVFFDIVCVVGSLLFLYYRCSLSFYHPAVWLLFYHIFNNSFRFFSVANGAHLLFSDSIDYMGASPEELKRAILWTDLSLVVTTLFIVAAESFTIKNTDYIKVRFANNKILWGVLIFSIPLGVFGAVTQLYLPSITQFANLASNEETNTSSYATLIQSWFGLSMLALIFFRGFKKIYVIPLLVYLVIIALQGYFRYRLILPIIFMISTYLAINNLRWPNKKHLIIMLLLFVVFYPLKQIGKIVQEGGGVNEVEEAISSSFDQSSKGDNNDQAFLDEYAMTLTEIDNKGKFYYGTTLLPIFISPIPRSWWPDKPSLEQWLIDISGRRRPFSTIGSIVTIYGESYANFGYVGILMIPALLFFFLTRWYNKIKPYPKDSIEFFIYLLIISCLLQVLRDGLISLFVFPVINSLPLFLIYLLHKVFVKPQMVKNVRKRKNNSYRDIAATV